MIQQRHYAPSKIVGRRAAAPRLALAHPRPVECDHLKACRKQRREIAPDLQRVGIAVEQENRRALAEPRHAETLAADELDRRRKHQRASSSSAFAASTPEIAQKLIHWPGCVDEPAR